MDIMDRRDAEIEEKRAFLAARALRGGSPHAPRADMIPEMYPITIIGCIRGVDGWYRAGYDERKKTVVPLEMVQKRSINCHDDCPTCANSDPKTNVCYEASTIRGGTPCIYWRPRENQ